MKKNIILIALAVLLLASVVLVPVVVNHIQESQNTFEDTISDEDRIITVDGVEITIPAGNKFLEWVTEGKSYLVEDQYGIRTIIIMEFD